MSILDELEKLHRLRGDTYSSAEVIDLVGRGATEIRQMRAGLDAAVRAANLALFVIRKQGVMPNSSWESGFEKDMAIAKAARGDEQTKEG